MKKVLCDINFVLDIFLRRKPFYLSTASVFKKIEGGDLKGYLCSLSFPTLFYLLAKELSREKTLRALEKLRIVFKVAPVDEKVIDMSLVSDFKDFEDAVQYYSALRVKADCIITRNKADYRESVIPVLTPDEFLAIVEN